MEPLQGLWETHCSAQWPEALGGAEGELMMLDTVIAGCVSYFMEEASLDDQRIGILQDSLSELQELLPELPDHAVSYFERLQALGVLLLNDQSKYDETS